MPYNTSYKEQNEVYLDRSGQLSLNIITMIIERRKKMIKKTVKLMNSAMMPEEGFYRCRSISPEEARWIIKQNNAQIESYIGYPETAQYMEKTLGVPVPVNRGNTRFDAGDIALICKLRYRVANPAEKGKQNIDTRDYEWFIVEYYGDRVLDVIQQLEQEIEQNLDMGR
jgi:hypothetical protein